MKWREGRKSENVEDRGLLGFPAVQREVSVGSDLS